MKKIITVILVILMLLSISACASNNALTGTWTLVEGDGGDYGEMLTFDNEGNFTCTALGISIVGAEEGSEGYEEAMNMLSAFSAATYSIKDSSNVEITTNELFGTQTTTDEVVYSINGDNLVFGDSTYTRVK